MNEQTRVKPELAVTTGQWGYVRCHCLVKTRSGRGGVFFTYECAACGNTNLRYIHTLEHNEDGRRIDVGVECARILLAPSDNKILGWPKTKLSGKSAGASTTASRAGALPQLRTWRDRGKL